MIRNSMKLFTLATNAQRLRGDHAQRIGKAMTVRPQAIALFEEMAIGRMNRIEQLLMIMTMIGLVGLVASVGWLLLLT